jgi:hypothetical protein
MSKEYTCGYCRDCKRYTALLNKRCKECNEKLQQIPDFLKNLMNGTDGQ